MVHQRDLGRWAAVALGHRQRLGHRIRTLPAQDRGHVRVLCSRDDHLADVLAPVFARPAAWRALDILIGIVMAVLAAGLLSSFLDG